jgi:hypothetical protein
VSALAIQIGRRAGGPVDANLLDGMAPQDLLVVENEWSAERSRIMQELLASAVPRPQWPQSLHWDWRRKAPELQLLECTGFGIVCEQSWQGLMLTRTASYRARLAPDNGKPLVYIDFLEIAPWNWVVPELGRQGRFRSVGSMLFWRAVKQSEQEGFKGRVGLHALPQAEQFYERACGMTPLGQDSGKENLLYLELTSQQARELLQEEHEQ